MERAAPGGNGRLYPTLRALQRFTSKIEIDPSTNCWEWTGATVAKGYGRFRRGTREEGVAWAHRWAYAVFVGRIPRGLSIDHICNNRSCVNPRHLRLLSLADNTARANHRRAVPAADDGEGDMPF